MAHRYRCYIYDDSELEKVGKVAGTPREYMLAPRWRIFSRRCRFLLYEAVGPLPPKQTVISAL